MSGGKITKKIAICEISCRYPKKRPLPVRERPPCGLRPALFLEPHLGPDAVHLRNVVIDERFARGIGPAADQIGIQRSDHLRDFEFRIVRAALFGPCFERAHHHLDTLLCGNGFDRFFVAAQRREGGNSVGEGNIEKAGQQADWLKIVSLIIGIFAGLVILLIRPLAVSFYNIPETTKELAGNMIRIQAGLVFFISITAVGVVGILRGGGDTHFALCTDLFTLWLVAVPAGLLSAFVFRLPVLLVYAAIKLDEPVKVFLIFWRLRNRNWIKNVTRERKEELA